MSRPILGPNQSPIQYAPALFLEAKWPGLEVNHSPPSIAEVMMVGAAPLLCLYAFMACTGTTLPLLFTKYDNWLCSLNQGFLVRYEISIKHKLLCLFCVFNGRLNLKDL
jgi:hypothetical protein